MWGAEPAASVRVGGGWFLHTGDACFYRKEERQQTRHGTPGLRVYQTMMEVDRAARLDKQARLRRLSLERRGEISVICARDIAEFEACAAGRPR